MVLDHHIVYLYLEKPNLTLLVYTGSARPPPGRRLCVHESELQRLLHLGPEEFRAVFERGAQDVEVE